MKNKALFGALLLLVASLVLGGCAGGISQEDYNAVVAERDAAKAQLTSLQDNIAKAGKYSALMAWHRSPNPPGMSEMEIMMEWQKRLAEVGDPELSALFKELTDHFMAEMQKGRSPEEIGASPEHQAIHMRACDYCDMKIAELLGVKE